MDIAKTNKGGQKISYQGFNYVLHRKCKGFIRWRCCKTTSAKCTGSLITTVEMQDPMPLQAHTHPIEETKIAVIKPRVKGAFSTCRTSFRVPLALSHENQQVLRVTSTAVVVPNLVIKDSWTTTGGTKPERFLLSDTGSDCQERKIIFATDVGLLHLSEATDWYLDENLSVPPIRFTQLYALRVRINGIFITAAFCLLTRKTQDNYESMLEIIVAECAQRGLYPDPLTVHLDFDKPLMLAVKAVLGDHVKVHGCFYHLEKSMRFKIQQLGLEEELEQDEDLKKFCEIINALAFLPVEDVEPAMTYLRKIASTQARPVLDHFDDTYVSGTFRKVGYPSSEGGLVPMRNIKAKFPPEFWNCKLDADVGLMECWNHRFVKTAEDKPPSIWTLINKMRQEVASDCVKIKPKTKANVQQKRKIKTSEMLHSRMVDICRQQCDGQRNYEDFLQAASRTLRALPK